MTPPQPAQRRYEALRAYFVEGHPAPRVASRFGYTTQAFESVVRNFRAGDTELFVERRPGPKVAPAKQAARARIVELRKAEHSIDEIAAALATEGTPLNRTRIAEVIADEGFERLWRRPDLARGGPRRETLPRAKVIEFSELAPRVDTKVAGLMLAVPELVALDLPALVGAAGYPGTSVIPAVSSILSLLALKLIGVRRVSHVDDLAADTGAALFAGLVALPKATALSTYSYRLSHERQCRFLAALDRAMAAEGLSRGGNFDVDFHAVMHWGEDVALEKHYVPKRSQRTRSVLTFFAQDAGTHNLVYANADVSKASQTRRVLAFCDHWRDHTGTDPAMLALDQRVTTHEILGELDALLRHIEAIEPGAWRTVSLDRDGSYRKPQVVDEIITITNYPGLIRQLIVRGLGRETPTVIITNDRSSTARQIIERYARRMTIEQRLAEAIRAFHLDALAFAVPLNVDLDVVLSVLAGAVCASLRRRLGGGGTIINREDGIVVRLDRRTYSPVLRPADIPQVAVPWWGGRTLRFDYA
jgi:hypothetical protein